ncbi:MAG TPA: CRTAC1 family protein [Planctomycetota bacterium]
MLFLALVLSGVEGQAEFSDATSQAGLAEPLAGMMGHGGAWGDVDGDGRPDLFVGGFCDRPNAEYAPAPGPVSARLFRNLGGGRFARVAPSEVEHAARTSGAVFADLDNDGDLDLVVANNAKGGPGAKGARSRLLRNDAGTLVDVPGAFPDDLSTARNVAVLDLDLDGLLDLAIVEDKFTRGEKTRTVLLRNIGGLKFEPANSAFGFPDDVFGLGHATADLNGDRRPDLFVGHSNRLFLSDGPRYKEADPAPFAWNPVDGEDWPCGVALADLNRDGRFDLVVSGHHAPARLRLWLGTADGFREATREAGLDALIPTKAAHVEARDFDNDGWPDLYVSAAWIDNGRVIPLIYKNLGDGRFQAPRPLAAPMIYYPAGPSADFDGDGRLDLFLVNWYAGRGSVLLRNESPARRWLDVRAVGKRSNRMGIGARVRVSKDGRLLSLQEISTGHGYASGQPALVHVGLGDAAAVDVLVTFPSGATVEKKDVAADQVLIVEEP